MQDITNAGFTSETKNASNRAPPSGGSPQDRLRRRWNAITVERIAQGKQADLGPWQAAIESLDTDADAFKRVRKTVGSGGPHFGIARIPENAADGDPFEARSRGGRNIHRNHLLRQRLEFARPVGKSAESRAY